MKILVCEPGKHPYVKDIEHTLENLQAEVDGYIQAIYPFEEQVGVIVNEEGLPSLFALASCLVGIFEGGFQSPDRNLDEVLAVAVAGFKVAALLHRDQVRRCDIKKLLVDASQRMLGSENLLLGLGEGCVGVRKRLGLADPEKLKAVCFGHSLKGCLAVLQHLQLVNCGFHFLLCHGGVPPFLFSAGCLPFRCVTYYHDLPGIASG